MRVLLINPPYQTLTSNLGVGHQVPLGLLMVGGALIDAGHTVRLLDAEYEHRSMNSIAGEVVTWRPEVVMTGHAGSTPAHPVCMKMLRAIKNAAPYVRTVYGGVYPSYHAGSILRDGTAADVVVRGEGEATAVRLFEAIGARRPLREVAGVTYREGRRIVSTPSPPPIQALDRWRTGWELIEDWDRYHCFGLGRAAIVQYSRGCPHRCTYCGQHGFWVKWRRRDPVRLVNEIEWLHRTHQVNFITLADENPTTLQQEWKRLLEELAARRLPVKLFATIRATDIVRDKAFLPLYREAGILYVLMGIDATSDATLRLINKHSTTREDELACRLLRENGIFSILGHVVGFEDETWRTIARAKRQLRRYDGDLLNAMYVTPHDWTLFGEQSAGRKIVEPDLKRWDYRHQVLAQRNLRPWQLFAAVKWMELWFHLRPSHIWRILKSRDRDRQRQILWCGLHIGMVWLGEVCEFALRSVLRRRWKWPRRTSVAEERSVSLPVLAEPIR